MPDTGCLQLAIHRGKIVISEGPCGIFYKKYLKPFSPAIER